MTAVAADPRGLKRICPSCGARYYDMNKRPPICPSCGAEFAIDTRSGRRRAAVAVKEEKAPEAEAAVEEEENLEVVAAVDPEATEDSEDVSLDDVQEMEEDDSDEEDVLDPDLGLDDGLDDFDTLEDEDDEDLDVSVGAPVEDED